MPKQTGSIERAGYPLAFLVERGTRANEVLSGDAGEVALRIEARSLYGHQKEVSVREGECGDAWRLVSDEGPSLKVPISHRKVRVNPQTCSAPAGR